MANFVYVDNSNVWIEGRHVAAVESGHAIDVATAMKYDYQDPTWSYDFGRLLDFAGGEANQVGRAVLYGSKPPPRDSLWAAAERKGFEVIVHDRSRFTGREKKVDTSLVTDVMTDAYTRLDQASDTITLVAGDADYVPAVQALRNIGITVDVCFWDQASRELKDVCSKFISLNPYVEHLRRQDPG